MKAIFGYGCAVIAALLVTLILNIMIDVKGGTAGEAPSPSPAQ